MADQELLTRTLQEMTRRRQSGETLITIESDLKWRGFSEEEVAQIVAQLPGFNHQVYRNKEFRGMGWVYLSFAAVLFVFSVGFFILSFQSDSVVTAFYDELQFKLYFWLVPGLTFLLSLFTVYLGVKELKKQEHEPFE